MDDREIVEQDVGVLLDQETHPEIQEHRSPSTKPRPMNSGGLIWLGLGR